MPEKQLMLLDINFLMVVGSFVIGVIGGAYAVFRVLRNMLKHDVRAMKETTDGVKISMAKLELQVKECEDEHVYTDVFKEALAPVQKQMTAIYDHLLNNPAHDKRSDDGGAC